MCIWLLIFLIDTFPEELIVYGLDKKLLASVYYQVQNGEKILKWHIPGVPNVGFYKQLHPFFKKWSITRGSTKVAIGQFYMAIDKNLAEKRCRADNAYRFIERIAKCNQPPDKLMTYGLDKAVSEVKVVQAEMRSCTEQVQKLNMEVDELRQQLCASKDELHSTMKR